MTLAVCVESSSLFPSPPSVVQKVLMIHLFDILVHVGAVETDARMLVGKPSGSADGFACQEDTCQAALRLRI